MALPGGARAQKPSDPLIDLTPVQLPTASAAIKPHLQVKQEAKPKAVSASFPPKIYTSRPSFTDSVTTVPQGSVQVESGATYTDNRDGTSGWTLPESLFRLGLSESTELRFTAPGYLYEESEQAGTLANNFGDTSLGLSHQLALPGNASLAVIPLLNLPTGASRVSSDSVDPQLRVVIGKAWTPRWFMSSHLDTRWNTGATAAADVVLNPTFINYYSFTENLTGFLEYSGFYPSEGRTTQLLQSGALYLISPRQQIDARIAVGLNQNSPTLLLGFGYSFRVDGLFGKSKEHSSFALFKKQAD